MYSLANSFSRSREGASFLLLHRSTTLYLISASHSFLRGAMTSIFSGSSFSTLMKSSAFGTETCCAILDTVHGSSVKMI